MVPNCILALLVIIGSALGFASASQCTRDDAVSPKLRSDYFSTATTERNVVDSNNNNNSQLDFVDVGYLSWEGEKVLVIIIYIIKEYFFYIKMVQSTILFITDSLDPGNFETKLYHHFSPARELSNLWVRGQMVLGNEYIVLFIRSIIHHLESSNERWLVLHRNVLLMGFLCERQL